MTDSKRRGAQSAPLCLLAVAATSLAFAFEPAPARVEFPTGAQGEALGHWSAQTFGVAFEIDRQGARIVAYGIRPLPFVRSGSVEPVRSSQGGSVPQVELRLHGSRSGSFVHRLEVPGLCLEHGPQTDPHIEGDTVRLHREIITVDLPAVEGWDDVEVAVHESGRRGLERRVLLTDRLDRARARVLPGVSPLAADALASAVPEDRSTLLLATSGAVIWPEQIGESDVWRIWGDLDAASQRINVVIVPDGYVPAERALMETHAEALVAGFRNKTPYREHDPFMNYILVFAYSVQSGTDQCDCSIFVDTAMGTRFPNAGGSCGSSTNRCLYYGNGCDTNSQANIAAAELRAPYRDQTIVMVNTTRYGGCGGLRAVYSAGNGAAVEVAIHELGHSLGGLADEYAGNASCGTFGGEINTSLDAVNGAWPEWIADLGPPVQGARYYNSCIYRPVTECEMRSLFQPFCAVCNQRWSLVTFGHPRVSPTAPIAAMTPSSPTTASVGIPRNFSVGTRLSAAPATHQITWSVTPPGGSPVAVASGTAELIHTFSVEGTHTVTCEVIADTNFVKPSRYGANRDVVNWAVDVAPLAPPAEVSSPGSDHPLRFVDGATLSWEALQGASAYNLYRGAISLPAPGDSGGACLQPNLGTPSAADASTPPPGDGWFYLAAARNAAGEGPLGHGTDGLPRQPASSCEPPPP